MGRKLVRESELLQSGGLLSFPRTGCALLRDGDFITGEELTLRSRQANRPWLLFERNIFAVRQFGMGL